MALENLGTSICMDDSLKTHTIIMFATQVNRCFVDTNFKIFQNSSILFVFFFPCFGVPQFGNNTVLPITFTAIKMLHWRACTTELKYHLFQ